MTDEPSTVILAQVPNDWQAQLIVDALNDRGIKAETAGELTAGFKAEAPGMVRVLVQREQVAAAREALDAHARESSEIDWSKVDVGERED